MQNNNYDIVIIGSGPAGIAAAVSSASNGAKVLVIDSNIDIGGQVYKPPPRTYKQLTKVSSKEVKIQKSFSKLIEENKIDIALEHTVWQVNQGFKVYAYNNNNSTTVWKCKVLIIATGTYERIIPFPGWTLPGVIGLAASTTLLKSHRVLPGKNTIVAGCGPLLAVVASGIIKAGGKVGAVIDLNSSLEWLSSITPMLSNPSNLFEGIGWLKNIIFARTPIYFNSAIESVTKKDNDLEITLVQKNFKKNRKIKLIADSLCVGHGLIPSVDISKSLGVELYFENSSSNWRPKINKYFQSSIEKLYIVGDGSGISGAIPAYEKGLIAGNASSYELKYIEKDRLDLITNKIFKRLKKLEKFGKSMAKLMTPSSQIIKNVTKDTIVCRCEDIKREEIEEAIKFGAREINQLKSWTRCGMGPCQGRTCEDAISRIMSEHLGSREKVGTFTRRFPLKPILMDDAVGEFEYDDIIKVEEAPL